MAESNGLDNSSKGSMNNEVALTFRNFKQIMNKKGKFQYSFRWKATRFKKKHKEESNEIICFECKKPRHMKMKCPQLKRKTHSGNKKSSSSDDEQANICPDCRYKQKS